MFPHVLMASPTQHGDLFVSCHTEHAYMNIQQLLVITCSIHSRQKPFCLSSLVAILDEPSCVPRTTVSVAMIRVPSPTPPLVHADPPLNWLSPNGSSAQPRMLLGAILLISIVGLWESVEASVDNRISLCFMLKGLIFSLYFFVICIIRSCCL